MDGRISDEDLWGLVDEDGSALTLHLARHPEDADRVADLRSAIDVAARASLLAATPAPSRIGSYRIEREIGRGGGGIVYEAWQEDPPRRVALKVLRDADRAEHAAWVRLRREARALGRLSHPHVATIFEAGVTPEGRPYVAVELVHGTTLTAHARERHLALPDRVRLFQDVCDAIHHAHGQGVIHRDIKPSNLLVDVEHGVKVVDFGLARLRDSGHGPATLDGAVLGTLGYMSSEQARGEDLDERTDVYSLGVVLYELIADAEPFDLRGKSTVEAIRILSDGRPMPLSTRVRAIDRDLVTIVMKAMEPAREARYGSAAALREDVSCWLTHRPILARRPTLGYRLRKLALRNKIAAGLLAVVALMLVIAAYAATFRPRFLNLGADWYRTASPFDGLRWSGDRPEVEVDGRWHELLSIDGLQIPYVVGFCKQDAGPSWRKRFSEDLLQALNLLGDWPLFDVDVVLRDLESGEIVERADLPLDGDKRQRILRDRNAWPMEPSRSTAGQVTFQGRDWIAVSLDGIELDGLDPHAREELERGHYDRYCAIAGRSPAARMTIVLRDPVSGVLSTFEGVEREPRDRRIGR